MAFKRAKVRIFPDPPNRCTVNQSTEQSIGQMAADPDCVCSGNWRQLVQKTRPIMNRRFFDPYTGKTYTFSGIVWAQDDFYYLMVPNDGGDCVQMSCVGDLTGSHGLVAIHEAVESMTMIYRKAFEKLGSSEMPC